jgi:hypothetical protein
VQGSSLKCTTIGQWNENENMKEKRIARELIKKSKAFI